MNDTHIGAQVCFGEIKYRERCGINRVENHKVISYNVVSDASTKWTPFAPVATRFIQNWNEMMGRRIYGCMPSPTTRMCLAEYNTYD